MTSKRLLYLPIGLLAISILAMAGCQSTQQNTTFTQGYTPPAGVTIEVGTVTNETGAALAADTEKNFAESLKNDISGNKMLYISGPGSKLVLNTKFVDYKPGQAWKRWLLPGWSNNVLTVHCDLMDGDKVAGSLEIRRTISWGAGYTFTPWKSIFPRVASDVADELKKKLME
jgi:hypothetical protein